MNKYVKGILLFGGGLITGVITGGAYVGYKVLSTDEFREALAKKISNKVTDILYGDESTVPGENRVSYRTYRSSGYSLDEIIFDTRINAEALLDQLKEIIDKFGFCTISDFYDLVGLPPKHTYTINDFGWKTLDKVTVARVRNGYTLNLPKPVRIEWKGAKHG